MTSMGLGSDRFQELVAALADGTHEASLKSTHEASLKSVMATARWVFPLALALDLLDVTEPQTVISSVKEIVRAVQAGVPLAPVVFLRKVVTILSNLRGLRIGQGYINLQQRRA